MTPDELMLLLASLEGGEEPMPEELASPEELAQLMAAGTADARGQLAQGRYSDALGMMQPRATSTGSVAGGVAGGLGNAFNGILGGFLAGRERDTLDALPGETAGARGLYAQLMARGKKDKKRGVMGDFPTTPFGLG